MPEDVPEPPTAPTEQEAQEPDKYTDEWYDSVEKRFKDLGEFIKSGKATHGAASEPQSPPSSTAPSQGQSPSHAETDGPTGETPLSAVDIRRPKPNHIWFRRLGE